MYGIGSFYRFDTTIMFFLFLAKKIKMPLNQIKFIRNDYSLKIYKMLLYHSKTLPKLFNLEIEKHL